MFPSLLGLLFGPEDGCSTFIRKRRITLRHIPEVNVCTLTNHDPMETQILSPHCIGNRPRALIASEETHVAASCCRTPGGLAAVTARLCSAKILPYRSQSETSRCVRAHRNAHLCRQWASGTDVWAKPGVCITRHVLSFEN
jgi:hypothetical protein